MSQQTSPPCSEHQDLVNPFADSPSFVATPSSHSQQNVQPLAAGASPHNQYQSSSPFPQQSTPGGHVVPWASGSPQSGDLEQKDQASGILQQTNSNQYNWQLEQQLQGGGGKVHFGALMEATPLQAYLPLPCSIQRGTDFSKSSRLNMSLQDSSRQASIGKLAHASSLPAGQNPTKAASGSSEETDKWFGDLVDFSSVSANFKKAGLTSSLTRPNTSKASGT
ncbi:hypothetical protein L7F22_065237 [Adiantum nelumboides]|nr:hypothetical protein [Adiantum nelumboides]